MRVAVEMPDGKYVVSSPNMTFIPRLVLESSGVEVYQNDHGHFGAFDGTRWPQIYVHDASIRWLAAVRRPSSDPNHPIWRPLDWHLHSPDLAWPPNPTSHSRCTLAEGVFRPLSKLCTNMRTRVARFVHKFGPAPVLEQLKKLMRGALDLANFPSTPRDVMRQHAATQRFWLLADAWLEWHVYLYPARADTRAVFKDPEGDRERPEGIRTDLMGAFTTHPTHAEKLYSVGLPVWFFRLTTQTQADSQSLVCRVIKSADMEVCPTVPVTLFASVPVYSGIVDSNTSLAILRSGLELLDIEQIPRAAAPPAAAPMAVTRTSSSGSSSAQRYQPCEFATFASGTS